MVVALWGAGKVGEIVGKCLISDNRYKVKYYLENDNDKVGKELNGISIVNYHYFKEHLQKDVDAVILTIGATPQKLPLYIKELSRLDVICAIIRRGDFITSNNSFSREQLLWLDDKPLLTQLEMHVEDKCNLNCKACSHFCNIHTKSYQPDLKTFIRDLRILREKATVNTFYFLGGEPLLNNRLPDYIYAIDDLIRGIDIRVVTNGMLIMQQDDNFWKCIRDTNTILEISSYEPLRKMHEKIEKYLDDKGVMYRIRSDVESFVAILNTSGDSNGDISQKKCLASLCRFLRDGIIYKCPVSALVKIYESQFESNVFPKASGVSLDDVNFDKELKKLENSIEMCKFCAENPRIISWECGKEPDYSDWLA